MNTKYYKQIVEQFKKYHPYLANGMVDWEPRGDMKIRVRMADGSEYDFHAMSNSIRNVKDRPVHHDDNYDEYGWRKVFSDRLTEYMCTQGISQQALAEYTGLSKGSINKYVSGSATPSGYALSKLATALGCTVMDLTD